MGDSLPSSFDAIVVGTGLSESIVAAALSRIGKSVLHIDRNTYYGSRWSSFSLRSLQNWAESSGLGKKNLQQVDSDSTEKQQQQQKQESPPVDVNSLLQDGEASLAVPRSDRGVSNIHLSYNHIFESAASGDNTYQDGTVKCQITDESTEGAKDGEESSECPEQQQQQQQQSGNHNKGEEEKSTHEERPADTEEAETKDGVLQVNDQPTTASTPENEKSHPDDDNHKRPEEDQKVGADDLQKHQTGRNHPKRWTVDEFKNQWRRFNFDLAPRVLYSNGEMVQLLIKSDISRYCEFKLVSRILTIHQDQVQCVPCSRAHVFNSEAVTRLDKRMMMKFVKTCQGEEPDNLIKEYADKPFTEYLNKKFSPIVKHYIYKAITMTKENTSTAEGIALAKKFFSSVGRFGNLPFITPIYGVGELPQAFSRMCAVWGGIYCLNLSVDSIFTNNGKVTGIVTNEGQRIECEHLIMEPSYLPENFIKSSDAQILSRAILVIDRPLMQSAKEELSVLNAYPPDDPERTCVMLEFPASTMVCPSGLSVVHLTRIGKSDPKSDLEYMCQFLFDFDPHGQEGPYAETNTDHSNDNQENSKPKVVWSFFFQMKSHQNLVLSQDAPSNLHATSQPGSELDLDFYPKEAKTIFEAMYPTEEFHPKCPNPEDIIYVGSEEGENKTEEEETATKDDDAKDEVKSSGEGDTTEAAAADEKAAEVNVEVASIEGVEQDLTNLKLDENEKKSTD